MSGSLNKVILIGNLGRDPEVRQTQAGQKIATLSLATSESWRDRQTGERREKTEWHRISVMSPTLSEVAEKHLRKGSKIAIEGKLQTRKWTDQSGQERTSTEVVIAQFNGSLTMLDSRNTSQQDQQTGTDTPPPQSSGTTSWGAELDDEIPF